MKPLCTVTIHVTQRPKVIAVKLWHIGGQHLRARLVLWNKFTHLNTQTLALIHARTAGGTQRGQKYSHTSLPLFLRCSTSFQSRLGVGPAADSKPIVEEQSLCQPIRRAWFWTVANGQWQYVQHSWGEGAFTHTGKEKVAIICSMDRLRWLWQCTSSLSN